MRVPLLFPSLLVALSACAGASLGGPVVRPGITLELDGSGPATAALVREALGPAGNTIVDGAWRSDTLVLNVVYARTRFQTATPEVAVLAVLPHARSSDTTRAQLVRLEAWYAPVQERAEPGTFHRAVVSTGPTGRAYPVRRGDPEWKRLEQVAEALEAVGARRVRP